MSTMQEREPMTSSVAGECVSHSATVNQKYKVTLRGYENNSNF